MQGRAGRANGLSRASVQTHSAGLCYFDGGNGGVCEQKLNPVGWFGGGVRSWLRFTEGAGSVRIYRFRCRSKTAIGLTPKSPRALLCVSCCYALRPFLVHQSFADYGTRLKPRNTKLTTKRIRKTKNNSFAIPADAAASPPNPNTAAINAKIRKASDHPNISLPPLGLPVAD